MILNSDTHWLNLSGLHYLQLLVNSNFLSTYYWLFGLRWPNTRLSLFICNSLHHLYYHLPYLYITDFHRMLKDYYSSQEFGGGWHSAVRARQHCHLDCKNCVYFYLYFISSVHDSISTSHTRSILFLFSSYKHFIFGPRTWKPRDYLLFHNSRPCYNYQYCL